MGFVKINNSLANYFGVRHLQVFLLFLGMVISFTLRVNISSAIVAMTTAKRGADYFNWDPSIKSVILSSFFWGYFVMQVPSGILARIYGAKSVYIIAMIIAGVATILNPIVVHSGNWQLLCVFRVIVGLTQAAVFPCTHHLISKWVPAKDLSFLGTFIYSGSQLGIALMLGVSGCIFESSLKWPGVFYITGVASLLWSAIFLMFGVESPAHSKLITKEERDYIERLTNIDTTHNAPKQVPWKSIFTSLPFYGILAAHCSYSWGFSTLMTNIPTYLNSVLNFNLNSNALLSALPYMVMWIVSWLISPTCGWLINKRYLSLAAARKLFNTIGQWIPMICLIIFGYIGHGQKVLAICILTIGVTFFSGCYCGFLINHLDIAPNFAGPIMGLTNGLSTVCSTIAPLVVGAVVSDETEQSQWRIIFFLAAAVYFVGNGLFIVFAKAKVQSWNNVEADIRKPVMP